MALLRSGCPPATLDTDPLQFSQRKFLITQSTLARRGVEEHTNLTTGMIHQTVDANGVAVIFWDPTNGGTKNRITPAALA
jgi:hypothetical protein